MHFLHISIEVVFLQDPEFFEFLKEHDKELLEFDDEDVDVSSLKLFGLPLSNACCLNSFDFWCRRMLMMVRKMQS